MNEPLLLQERRHNRNIHQIALPGVALFLCSLSASAQILTSNRLADLSIEELVNIQITSVSKRSEPLANAAASVFVLTGEEIRRSGATSLPEALRLAPNLHVAQSSASGYAISARGFNGSNSSAPNKLLVLIDGRSVYTPLFSGVFWDAQDVMLEDVERIEVISGPGGTLWGVNAVNGIINVITRSAKDTKGELVAFEGGNRGANTAFRHGGMMGAYGHYRVYGKYSDRRHTSTENGNAVNDAWHKSQLGFRIDWERPNDQFTLHGNIYDGAEDQPAPGALVISGVDLLLGKIPLSGVNLTGQWTRLLENGSNLNFQIYLDRTKRTVPPTFSEMLDLIDVQFQHSLRTAGIHTMVWGANYRYGMDKVVNSTYFAFLPANINQKWASLFAQDEMALRKDLRLILGTRIERNDYTGSEFLPSMRLAWQFTPDHLLWAAASRTIRAPSRLDHDAFIPGNPPFLLAGGNNVRSEVAKVYEVGYRAQPVTRFSYSITAFHADYDHLRTQEIAPSRTFLTFASEMEGTTSGIEMWGTYQLSQRWRLSAGFSALRERLWLKAGSNDILGPNAAGKDPAHAWQLRSTYNIDANRELDIAVRHVAALSNPDVPKYTAVDARFGWNVQRNLELSITGQNLFGGHAEYGPLLTRSDIPRSIFMKLTWQY